MTKDILGNWSRDTVVRERASEKGKRLHHTAYSRPRARRLRRNRNSSLVSWGTTQNDLGPPRDHSWEGKRFAHAFFRTRQHSYLLYAHQISGHIIKPCGSSTVVVCMRHTQEILVSVNVLSKSCGDINLHMQLSSVLDVWENNVEHLMYEGLLPWLSLRGSPSLPTLRWNDLVTLV